MKGSKKCWHKASWKKPTKTATIYNLKFLFLFFWFLLLVGQPANNDIVRGQICFPKINKMSWLKVIYNWMAKKTIKLCKFLHHQIIPTCVCTKANRMRITNIYYLWKFIFIIINTKKFFSLVYNFPTKYSCAYCSSNYFLM